MTAPTRMSFGARLRLLRNKRYEDWWHIVFGGPVGVFMAALVADVAWITPNRVTMLGFVVRIAGALLLLARDPWADVVALVLLQLNVALDIMDGSLARYRKRPSALGAFLDKVTDAFGLSTLGWMLGVRAYLDGHGPVYLAAGGMIGTAFLIRCYMYWVVAYLERERAAPATVGPDSIRPFGELNFGERMRYYVAQSWRILLFGEGDVYFWVGLALAFGKPHLVVLPLAATMTAGIVLIGVKRVSTVMRLDRDAQAAKDAGR